MNVSDARKLQPQPVEPPVDELDARSFAIAVARIADADKIEHVRILDLRGLTSLADYFVIGTGTSNRQMHAVIDHVHEHARAAGRAPFNVADTGDTTWLLVDYIDVVLHLFDEEHRAYYDLDGLWGDAREVRWSTPDDGDGA